jgi:hypothetical protein
MQCLPVLEPDLDGSLRHVDFLCYPLANTGGGSGVLVELEVEDHDLVLSGSLALLVLLLLSEGALPRGTA